MNIAILGGGQLGRMLALAGIPLGMKFRFLSTGGDACAGDVGELIVAGPEGFIDEGAIKRLCQSADVVTYEFENIPARAVEIAARYAPVYPGALALTLAQDRVDEKNFFRSIETQTPDFHAVASRDDLDAAARSLGVPMVLKTRRFGYDGKGQRLIRAHDDLAAAWSDLGRHPGGLIAERFVRFDRELSVIGVRSARGEVGVYPLTENVHREGILHTSIAPAPGLSPELVAQAHGIVTRAMHELDYVGVLAIELFEVSGALLVNEMAPRVHNSGHWTIDGSETSQFENHLRAIIGVPLGPTSMRAGVTHAGMLNLVGDHPPIARLMALRDARVHLYGKTPKPGRKLGHINLAADTGEQLRAAMLEAEMLTGQA